MPDRSGAPAVVAWRSAARQALIMRWFRFVILSCLPLAGLPAAMATDQRSSLQIDINRPQSPFECDLPIGTAWYGSSDRCLEELCAGQNVFNEYIFDNHNRRRRNPCYGQSPTEFRR